MQMKWTILIRYEGPGAHDELQEIGRFERPPDMATAADFGLSRAEGQTLLANLQGVLTQQQVYAYDERRRHLSSLRPLPTYQGLASESRGYSLGPCSVARAKGSVVPMHAGTAGRQRRPH